MVSDREPSRSVDINGAHKPWRIHLRMSRDEFSSRLVAPCAYSSYLISIFARRRRGTNRGWVSKRFANRKSLSVCDAKSRRNVWTWNYEIFSLGIEWRKRVNFLILNLPSSVKCAPPIFVLTSGKRETRDSSSAKYQIQVSKFTLYGELILIYDCIPYCARDAKRQ